MERKTWKWIIEQLPGKFRAEMIVHMDIQIPGFRKEALLVGKGIDRLTATLLQTRYRLKLKLYLLECKEELGMSPCYVEMAEDELKKCVQKGEALSVLLTLLLQPEEEVIEKGEHLYSWMEVEGLLETHKEVRKPLSDKGEKASGTTGSCDSKRIKKMEEKIIRLREEQEEHQEFWKGKQLEWKKEKLELLTEVKGLKTLLKEMEKTNIDLKKENVGVTKQLDEMKKVNRKPVALIGNPHNDKVESSSRFSIRIIESKEVEKAILEKRLHDVEEIWILTYQTPIGKIRMLRNLKPEKIVEFSTFVDLERYIE